MAKNSNDKKFKSGSLPGTSAPLAMSYVPMQTSAKPSYETVEALSRGTLFPGLDLPFFNIINNDLPMTPENELMAICFVAHELALYLDTHPQDEEAFAMLQTFLALQQEAHDRYSCSCGPIVQKDQLGMSEYKWLNNPWPWEYTPKMEV